MTDDLLRAPWTPELVEALNRSQTMRWMHPFTCGCEHRGDHPVRDGNQGILRATEQGWVSDDCEYTQDWAHAFMADTDQLDAAEKVYTRFYSRLGHSFKRDTESHPGVQG